jgi:hypothetical protein
LIWLGHFKGAFGEEGEQTETVERDLLGEDLPIVFYLFKNGLVDVQGRLVDADGIALVEALGQSLGKGLALGDKFGGVALDVPGAVLEPVGQVGPLL